MRKVQLIKEINNNPNIGKNIKLAGSVPMSILLTLPREDQELFMKDPLIFFKKYPQFATKYGR